LIAALSGAATFAWAQASPHAQVDSKSAASSSANQPAALPANSSWQTLTVLQRKALAPLAPYWAQLNAAQKKKWLAISANFDKLSDKEQSVLHERMAEWASLSPQQRALARLSFNETKGLDADAKKTQWEAYQALSSADKKKLAAQQTTVIQGAATASKAPPTHKVMRLPSKSTPSSDNAKLSTGTVIDKKTLLPTTVIIPEGT
jgi:hypothetical protein